MPDQFTWNQFKSGWIPSDDDTNGRKDGCLQMDNVELDKNGALSMVGGTTVLGSAYTYNAHTLYSLSKGIFRFDYLADANGGIFRNGSSIATGGDSLNAAFSVAYNYVIAASGTTRVKDTGSGSVVNLGILASNAAVSVTGGGATYTPALSITSTVDLRNSATFMTKAGTVITTTNPDNAVVQSYVTNGPIDWSSKNSLFVDPARSTDILGGQSFGTLKFYGFSGVYTNPPFKSVTIDILLEQPNASGDQVTNYFRAQIDTSNAIYTVRANLIPAFGIPNFGPSVQTFGPAIPVNYLFSAGFSSDLPINVTRGDFIRYGTSSAGWNTVYGFRVSVATNGPVVCSMNFPEWFQGGLIGDYQWMQINVNANGSYVGKSTISPISVAKTLNNEIPLIQSSFSVSGDPQINQTWTFRRGGGLDQWYRVKVLTSSYTSAFYDEVSDDDALTLGITFDPSLISAASTGFSQKIYDIIGPIEGRWFYFTGTFMYPSDINDPDLVQPQLAVALQAGRTGSSEIYFWARRIADNSILVGTSTDIHILTGTFVTLPDGTVDIFYRSLGCAHPPVTNDATTAIDGRVIYLATDGWRSIDSSGASTLLVSPNTDRLYRGQTCYGYGGILTGSLPATNIRYPVIYTKNKLWCSIYNRSRIEVLDPIREYWRPMGYSFGAPTAMCPTQDGQILAFFGDSTHGDNKLRIIDYQPSRLIDGTTNQPVAILSPIFTGGTPDQRKDFYTLTIKISTGGSNLSVTVFDDTGTSHAVGTINITGGTQIVTLPISQNIVLSRSFQFLLSGTCADLTLQEMVLYYDTRPIPLTFVRIYNTNFGNSSKKRVRVWPLVIDTRGGTATFQPFVDGTPVATTDLASNSPIGSNDGKTTLNTFYKTDVFGIDYGGTITADAPSNPFEFFGMMAPDIVQVLPIARQFDQVGPEELFRYGKIKQFEIRVLPYGTSIPWTMYFNDNSTKTGSITCVSGQESSYMIGLPQGAGGSIVRVEFGPTSFNFHRFYVRLQVMKSGRDTDMEWITIPDPAAGE